MSQATTEALIARLMYPVARALRDVGQVLGLSLESAVEPELVAPIDPATQAKALDTLPVSPSASAPAPRPVGVLKAVRAGEMQTGAVRLAASPLVSVSPVPAHPATRAPGSGELARVRPDVTRPELGPLAGAAQVVGQRGVLRQTGESKEESGHAWRPASVPSTKLPPETTQSEEPQAVLTSEASAAPQQLLSSAPHPAPAPHREEGSPVESESLIPLAPPPAQPDVPRSELAPLVEAAARNFAAPRSTPGPRNLVPLVPRSTPPPGEPAQVVVPHAALRQTGESKEESGHAWRPASVPSTKLPPETTQSEEPRAVLTSEASAAPQQLLSSAPYPAPALGVASPPRVRSRASPPVATARVPLILRSRTPRAIAAADLSSAPEVLDPGVTRSLRLVPAPSEVPSLGAPLSGTPRVLPKEAIDREQLADAIEELLCDAARREGLEV